MSIDTKGCLVTANKDPFSIVGAINHWFYTQRDKNNLTFADFRKEDPEWKYPKATISENYTIQVYFKYKNEDRMLFICLDCDGDLKNHEEIQGDSCIWFSLGYWGSSVEIMKGVLNFMKQYGDCYIDENDCDEEGFYKV